MCGVRFEEIQPGTDICHQSYVRADKSGTALARACKICDMRIWDHHTGLTEPRQPMLILHRKQLEICISVYVCVNISLIMNSFYNIVLSLFKLLFQNRREN